MSKQHLLSAKTFVAHGGNRYGLGMQFHADTETAERLVASGEAETVGKPAPVVAKKAPAAKKTRAAKADKTAAYPFVPDGTETVKTE